MSGKLTPAALTSITTCPAEAVRSGISSTRSVEGPVSSWIRTARMFFPTSLLGDRIRTEHAELGGQRLDVVECGMERLARGVAEHVGVEPVGERRVGDRA